jgi:hypothetical protein
MWAEVVFEDIGAARGMEMAWSLRDAGLVLDKDFTWCYIPKAADPVTINELTLFGKNVRKVIIGFRDPALATFYQLKWSRS